MARRESARGGSAMPGRSSSRSASPPFLVLTLALLRAVDAGDLADRHRRQRPDQPGITFSVRLAFWIARRIVGAGRLAGLSPGLRSIYLTLVPIAGVAVGWPLGMLAAGRLDERFMAPLVRPGVLGSSIVVALLITALPQQFFRTKSRQIQAEDRATEAQLRLLQAQIEPHFLFNTLANVVSLMDADAPRAKAMLEAFVDYLRASLSGSDTAATRSATRST